MEKSKRAEIVADLAFSVHTGIDKFSESLSDDDQLSITEVVGVLEVVKMRIMSMHLVQEGEVPEGPVID